MSLGCGECKKLASPRHNRSIQFCSCFDQKNLFKVHVVLWKNVNPTSTITDQRSITLHISRPYFHILSSQNYLPPPLRLRSRLWTIPNRNVIYPVSFLGARFQRKYLISFFFLFVTLVTKMFLI